MLTRSFINSGYKLFLQYGSHYTTSVGLQELDPLHLQPVNRSLFDSLMSESLVLKRPPGGARTKTRLLADEQNAVRYASGYVVMKISKKLKKRSDGKAAGVLSDGSFTSPNVRIKW